MFTTECDKNIDNLVLEIDKIRIKNPNLTYSQIKELIKEKGNDDELDLAIGLQKLYSEDYSFSRFNILLILFGWGSVILFFTQILENFVGAILKNYSNVYLKNILGIFFLIFVTGFFVNLICRYFYIQKYKIFLLLNVFEAREIKDLDFLRKKMYFLPSNCRFGEVYEMFFDGKKSLFGSFSFGQQVVDKTISRSYVFSLQYLDKSFPEVLVRPNDSSIFINVWNTQAMENISLESNDFNDTFIINSRESKKSAFYTLDPRLMAYLLNIFSQNDYSKIIKYPAFGNYSLVYIVDNIAMVVKEGELPGLPARIDRPLILFDDYLKIKKIIVSTLDSVVDLSKLLSKKAIDK